MSTTVIVGYSDGAPLETAACVDLLVNGQVVATASPDASGQLLFAADIPSGAAPAIRLVAPSATGDLAR